MEFPAAAFTGLVPVVVAIVTARLGWTQWKSRRREEQVGLFVNPFMLAAEDLQSRLFNILERDGLRSILRRMSAEEAAMETLYLAARYFGWERVVYQHGPYTKDQTFVSLTQKLRKAFATDTGGTGPFCIFRTEQADLGQLVVKPAASGNWFESLPLHMFGATLRQTGLGDRASVSDTSGAFNRGAIPDSVRHRLATAHGVLVDLLEHLERGERIRLFGEERRSRACAEVSGSTPARRAA